MNLVLSDRPLAGFGQRHPELNFIDLSALHIANCVGCFGCWTKHPCRGKQKRSACRKCAYTRNYNKRHRKYNRPNQPNSN